MDERKRTFSVKDIADLAGVSKPTAHKVIIDMNIKPVQTENNGRRLYAYADGLKVIGQLKPDFQLSEICGKTEKPQNETANFPENALEITAKLQNEQINALQSTIDILRNQLQELNSQLKEKDKQIEAANNTVIALSERLRDALQVTKGQQYLAAADKIDKAESVKEETVIEQPAAEPEPEPEPKKPGTRKRSLFGFWRKQG